MLPSLKRHLTDNVVIVQPCFKLFVFQDRFHLFEGWEQIVRTVLVQVLYVVERMRFPTLKLWNLTKGIVISTE